jgi:FAD/FMN-containing dehydrogenase
MSISKNIDEILDQLKAIVGPKNYIDDALKMDPYLSDWRNQFHGASPLILKPLNTHMVSEILALCNENHIKVVPQGGNTGLVGGSVPDDSGLEVVVCLEKMNKILDIDPVDFDCRVQANVTREQLNEHLREDGVFFPIDPGANAAIGGIGKKTPSSLKCSFNCSLVTLA